MRYLFIIIGTVSLLFGVFGALAPIIPAVPFILLAAYCYARGSERFHTWLTEHRIFGPMIKRYHRVGIPPSMKLLTVAGVTVSVAVSFYFIDATTPRIMLLLTWLFITLVVIWLPYRRDAEDKLIFTERTDKAQR